MKLAALLQPRFGRPVNPSASVARLLENPRLAGRGLTPTDGRVEEVLTEAWLHGFSTRSNFARENAEAVACACAEGLITTRYPSGEYGSVWRCTARGANQLLEDPPRVRTHVA